MDDLTFFHEGTLRICGSLDMDNALPGCLAFLKRFMPVNCLELSVYEPDLGGIRILSQISDSEILPSLAAFHPLSQESRDFIEETETDGERIRIVNMPHENPVSAELFKTHGSKYPSVMGLRLQIKEERLGVVLVLAKLENQFNQEHGRLLELLHDPFAIAMSNTLRYRELDRLREMLDDHNQYLRQELLKFIGDEIVGADFGLKEVMEMVRQVAPLNSNVLLLGETGVGKEVIAGSLHYASGRKSGPFIPVNCGAIPESLMDTELFGHEKGAFTGALSRKRGHFERAHGGTLFLDEIGELTPAAQSRLLRVLQSKRIERIGGTEKVGADVRVIAATHRNLEEMVRKGAFREDLWYRLNVFPITIPPLRQRKSDIPALVDHFIKRKTREMKITRVPGLAPGALERLQRHSWPGNVRELENAVERELIRSQTHVQGGELQFLDLLPDRKVVGGSDVFAEPQVPLMMDDAIRLHIQKVVGVTGGKIQGKDGAAALLRMHPSTLRHRMRKLGITFGKKRKTLSET